jgi:cytochrome c oxidase subunit IV
MPAVPSEAKAPPGRPPLSNPNTAPVLAKLTPPFSVRVCELFWIVSFFVGGFAIVYYFIIRKEQLPLISDAVRAVDATRSEQTYTTAADIIFWSVFGILVGVLLVQITLLVSFMGRRPQMRWWQLLTWVIQVATLALSLDLALTGSRAAPLRLILAAQCGLVLLALLAGVMPKALAWSARQHDIVRQQPADASAR